MSYINTALRKVQKERDGRYLAYGNIIASTPARSSRGKKRRYLVVAAAVMVPFLILAIVAYSLYSSAVEARKGPTAQVPPKAAVAPPAQATGATPEGDRPGITRAAKLYEEALGAQRGKRWEEAESFYRQALSLDPRHVYALNNLGVLYMSKHRYDEAIELFVKAVAAKEDYVDPYYNLACLYAQRDNASAALLYLEKAVKIDGKVRKWANNDADFKRLRLLPDFKKITEELVK